VSSLFDYLSAKHGEDAPDIIEKFSNTGRAHVIVEAEISGEQVDGFFMIPSLTGWHNSNLKGFIQVNGLDSDIDTDVQEELDRWVGNSAQGVLDKTPNGTFLRLAK
jgi:hypothetical protein